MKRTLTTKVSLAFLMMLACWNFVSAQSLPTYDLLLKSGKVEVQENIQEFDRFGTLSEQEVINGKFYRYLQFYHVPNAENLRAIEAAGIDLLHYVPENTYFAAIPTSMQAPTLQGLGVRAILEVEKSWKIDPILNAGTIGEWAYVKDQVELIVRYHKNLDHADVLAYCQADDLTVIRENGHQPTIRIRVPESRALAVADLPYISYVETAPHPGEPEDVEGRALHRAQFIDTETATGRHYTGEGLGVLVRDDGFVGPHIDFHGRMTQDVNGDGGINHADGVAGILTGAGNFDPRNRGMAAGSEVFVLDYQADFLDNTMDLHLDNNVLVTNSSYSNGCNVGYTTITQTCDEQMYMNETFLHVFSAGNSNNNNCGYGAGNQWGNITGGHKQGKNVIATANLFDNASLVNSSSRGPAHDGRIKPDIAANGQDQVSTDPFNQYDEFGGTSGAAPGIAGVTAQLHQAYRETTGEVAKAALLKAVMMNTANDLGNEGPDFRYGWGHINAYRAALAIEEGRYFSNAVSTGETATHDIEIPAGVRQVKIMTYWHDYPAAAEASIALVNDLDTDLTGPAGEVFLPWTLDETPDPALLNLPATTGTDRLNNVEQIAIEDPTEGTYTLSVAGFEVPFGPQEYWVTIEYIMDDITVIYPMGGEGLEPGQTSIIHWDAYGDNGDFTLEFSEDNGGSWNTIQTVGASTRLYFWTVPSSLTGQALVRVTRNSVSAVSTETFSIMDVPTNLDVTQACPDYIRLTWEGVDEATSYEVFRLGDRYMDPVGTSNDLFFDVPTFNSNPTGDYYFAVRALGDNGLRSRRTNAYFYNDGLQDCDLGVDVSVIAVAEPINTNLVSCGLFDEPITIEVTNGGNTEQSNIEVGLQLDNNPALTGMIPGPVGPGETVPFTFSENLVINNSGSLELVTWANVADDEAFFNDTLELDINALIYVGNGEPLDFVEPFDDDGGALPQNWAINNPDNGITWQADFVTGADGDFTIAFFVNNFSYSDEGQEDELQSLPIDLTVNASNPVLTFDVAYAPYSAAFNDALRVDVYTECGANFIGTIYEKAYLELATTSATTAVWSPGSPNDWRNESIDLTNFVGESILLKFVNITGYGNSLYVDNINITNFIPPSANYTANNTEICQGSQVLFQDASDAPNSDLTWNFGPGAIPSTAFGSGPHIVTFGQAGVNSVSLTASNAIGSDTYTSDITVLGTPEAAFDVQVQDGIIFITNNSTGATEYTWDFGDGDGSDEENPIHIYDQDGTYTITLTAENDCGSNSATFEVSVIISSTFTLGAEVRTSIAPNPSTGSFVLRIDQLPTDRADLVIVDAQGRLVHTQILNLVNGHAQETIRLESLAGGVYLLRLSTDQGVRTERLVIQK